MLSCNPSLAGPPARAVATALFCDTGRIRYASFMQAEINGERTLTELDFARLIKPGGIRTGCTGRGDDVFASESCRSGFALATQAAQCCLRDAKPGMGFISVLSPTDARLLGWRVSVFSLFY